MLSGHIYEFPEMQSVRQYWILQLELKKCSSEKDIIFRVGNEAQDALRQQRARMLDKQNQLVQEGAGEISLVRHQIEWEQGT